ESEESGRGGAGRGGVQLAARSRRGGRRRQGAQSLRSVRRRFDLLVPAGTGAGRPGEIRLREEAPRRGERLQVGGEARWLPDRGEQRPRLRRSQCASAGAAVGMPPEGDGEGGSGTRRGSSSEGARDQSGPAGAVFVEQAGR